MIDISLIEQTDPEIAEALKSELYRQQNNIELIASENFSGGYGGCRKPSYE